MVTRMRSPVVFVVMLVGALCWPIESAWGGPCYCVPALSDFNGDGRADIAILPNSPNGTAFAYFMDGGAVLGAGPLPGPPGAAWTLSGYPSAGTRSGLAIRDATTEVGYAFDIVDFAAANLFAQVIWTYAEGQSFAGYRDESLALDIGNGFLFQVGLDQFDFDPAWTGALPGAPPGYEVVGYPDVNGDGILDVAVAGPALPGFLWIWHIGSCDGLQCEILSASAYPGPPTGFHVAGFPDVNGDGIDDILLAQDDGGGLYGYRLKFNAPSLVDVIAEAGPVGTLPAGATLAGIGDLDGDGNDDLVLDVGGGFLYLWTLDGLEITGGSPLPGAPVETHRFPGLQHVTPSL